LLKTVIGEETVLEFDFSVARLLIGLSTISRVVLELLTIATE